MIEVKFQELHFVPAVRAHERVVAEGRKNGSTPLVETAIEGALGSGDGMIEMIVDLAMSCIEAAIADHLEMFFRDMPDETPDEVHGRESFLDIFFIPVTIIVEGDGVAIVVIDPGRGDDRSTKITADVLDDGFRVTKSRFCIDVKALFMILVTLGLRFFEGGAKEGFHLVQESGTKGIAQKGIVEVFDMTPETVITIPTFGNEAMDMRIPFEIPAESVQDHDETGSEVFDLVDLKEHAGDDAINGMEKTVEQGAVIEEKVAEFFVNGKDAMAMGNMDQFEGHTGSTFHGILDTARRAESTVTAKGNE